MLTWLRSLFGKLYLLLSHIGGTRLFKPIPEKELDIDGINVVTVHGYTVNFYCQEIKYNLIHHRLRWTKEYVLFKMYSTAVGDAPDKLKQVISQDVYLPMIVPSFIPKDIRRRLILEAYIDVLTLRLNELEKDMETK